jgi:intracellular multiplication protein IcmE
MSELNNESSAIDSHPEVAESQIGARRLDPGFSRNLKIIAGTLIVAILVVVALVMRLGGQEIKAAPRSDVSLGTPAGQMVSSELTPDMRKRLDAKQKEESSTAAQRNQSYIPPDLPSATSPVTAVGPAPGESSFAHAGAPANQYARTLSEEDQRRREGLNRQMAVLVGEESSVNGGVRQTIRAQDEAAGRQVVPGVGPLAAGPAGVVAPAAAGSVTQSTAGANAQAAAKVLVPGLDIAAGELASSLRVPANASTFASARVTSGPAAGAYMIGTAKVVDEGLEIAFTQMRLGEKVYKVDAIVLDETTAANALSGNVDRRLLQRYVLPVALAAAQGVALAKSLTGSTVVTVGLTGSGIETPPPTAEQARAAGVAAGLQVASNEIQKNANAPIIVSKEMRSAVGILFRAPVTEDTR